MSEQVVRDAPRRVPHVDAVEFEGASAGAVLRAAARWSEAAGSSDIVTVRWDDRIVYHGYDPRDDARYVLTLYYE